LAESGAPELRRLGAGEAPLSFAQERLWLVDAGAPGSVTYNVPILLRWRGRVDAAALGTALESVVRRHEILRTTYHLRDGRPVQVVGAPGSIPVEVAEVRGSDAWPDALEAARARAREPFDLSRRPPLRCAVWPGIPGGDAVLLSMHHIAVDGWSLATLFEDLALAYDAAIDGTRAELPELPLQYADFAAWDRAAFATAEMDRQLSDRLAELIRVPPGLTLAGWRPPAPAPEGARRGAEHVLRIRPETWAGLHELATRLRVTPFVACLSAFAVALQRWSGRHEFRVGAVAANRSRIELEGLVGFFVNTVPVRCRLRPQWSFAELCARVRGEAFRVHTHQRLPLDRLTARAAAEHAGGHVPLVDVGFALQNVPRRALGAWPRWGAPRILHTGTAKFDLLLVLEEREDGPACTVEHDLDRYPADLGRRVGESFLAILEAVVADAGQPLWRLPVTGRTAGGLPAGVLAGPDRDLVAERLRRIEAGAGSTAR
jgi:hypothetical protein